MGQLLNFEFDCNAQRFADCVEYSQELGSGARFNLPNYYRLCDTIVDAFKQHPSLLEKHAATLNSKCKVDDDLHIMAFDLMYCCRCYNYYNGLSFTKKSRNAKQAAAANAAEEKQKSLREQIAALSEEKAPLEEQLMETECVSLLGTLVSSPAYGDGIVTDQTDNKLTVDFSGIRKSYVLHRKYPQRPFFEDNEAILDLMSERGDILERLDHIKKELQRCEGKLS